MTKQIPLTQGKVALVDDADFPRLSQHKWQFHKGYAKRTYRVKGRRYSQQMHREILRCPYGDVSIEVDHIDGNGLNNQKSNLRLATKSQNQFNRPAPRNNTSGYKGVQYVRAARKWRAQITVNGHTVHIGLFNHKEDAAYAYDSFARKHANTFAVTNFETRKEVVIPRVSNKWGYAGVRYHPDCHKWYAMIKHNRKRIYLGLFNSPEAAGKAYADAKRTGKGQRR